MYIGQNIPILDYITLDVSAILNWNENFFILVL